MAKYIAVKNGSGYECTLVDDDVYEWASKLVWYAQPKSNGLYVQRHEDRRTIALAREIMQCPQGLKVDHINHDTLDNRRENLRIVTESQNQQNRKGARQDSGTGIRGVQFLKDKRLYRAYACVGRKMHQFGYFKQIEDAEQAAIEGRRRLFTHTSDHQHV
jgi:hypothetical protein